MNRNILTMSFTIAYYFLNIQQNVVILEVKLVFTMHETRTSYHYYPPFQSNLNTAHAQKPNRMPARAIT